MVDELDGDDSDIPSRSPESEALSKDLKKAGLTFVGSVMCFALMEATGMVGEGHRGCGLSRTIPAQQSTPRSPLLRVGKGGFAVRYAAAR
ncbi:DNA-3-methyladenine glycosylase I, partial [Corynebacterium sp.]|uniref:DNA-3-methyladenine glycosylase I n=1 Tax=Corynebacterium sp. TaxID=1720 RepID=UPI0026E0C043